MELEAGAHPSSFSFVFWSSSRQRNSSFQALPPTCARFQTERGRESLIHSTQKVTWNSVVTPGSSKEKKKKKKKKLI